MPAMFALAAIVAAVLALPSGAQEEILPSTTTNAAIDDRSGPPLSRKAPDGTPLIELEPSEAPDVGAGRMLLAIDAIAELGGFERSSMASDAALLRTIRSEVPADGLDEDGYTEELERFVLDVRPYLELLEANGVEVSEDLWTATLALEDVLFADYDPDTSDPDDSGLLEPEPWLDGLADLLVRDATSATTPTPDADQAAIRALLTQFSNTASPNRTERPSESPEAAAPETLTLEVDSPQDTSGFPLVPAAATGGVVLLVITVGARRRRPQRPSTERAVFRPDRTPSPSNSPRKVADLLDASRRMSATLDAPAIAAIALEEARRIVDSDGGIVVRRTDDGVESIGCTPSHLFDPLQISESCLPRLVETGRSMASIATDEPLLAELPMAMGAVPIVTDGVITGAIMVVRVSERPFDRDHLDALEMLAPLVGSALAVAQTHESAQELVDVEPLTGLHNRRRLDLDLAAISADDEVAYLMVDIDHFKNFNDANGHAAGDEALRTVSGILQSSVRPNDFVYRYGGEEFCVLLPGASGQDAMLIAERARRAVETADIPGMEHQPAGRVTISVGISDSAFGGPEHLVERADAALYESKRSGRNCVTVSN